MLGCALPDLVMLITMRPSPLHCCRIRHTQATPGLSAWMR